MIASRFEAATAVPWLSWRKPAVSVAAVFTLTTAGDAVCASTMNGSKVTVPDMVGAGVFVPHQFGPAKLALTVDDTLSRLLPVAAVLPANRLKLTCSTVPAPPLETSIAPPRPVAVLFRN